MRWTLIPVVLMMLVLCSSVSMGGQLNPPSGPDNPGSAMYTLEDIYQRLVFGTAGAPRTGGFQGPSGAPGSTMHNLNDIMGQTPTADNTNGAAPSDVLKGRTFWGLRTGGTWGPQTGTAEARTGDATVSDVLTGKTFSNAIGSDLSGSMPNVGAQTIMPGTTSQTISLGYHNGSGTVAGDSALVSGNIVNGKTVFGVSGLALVSTGDAAAGDVLTGKTFSNAGAVSVPGQMPHRDGDNTSTDQAAAGGVNYFEAPSGYYDGNDRVSATDAQVATLAATLVPENVRDGTRIFGVLGTMAQSPNCNDLAYEIAMDCIYNRSWRHYMPVPAWCGDLSEVIKDLLRSKGM